MKEPPTIESEPPPLVSCPHCGSTVPAGEFCGHCGAHLPSGSARRPHAYAAVPSQRVVHLAIVSTLFPHLPHRGGRPFRLGLLAAGVVVLSLSVLHLYAMATVAAAFALPVLYLMYLYEVEVYESEPWLVVGATMVIGALFGLAFTNVTARSLSHMNLTADSDTGFLLAGLVIPITSQALMLAGPLFLYMFHARFREPLDGLTFGAASALGFSLTSSLVAFWPLISSDSMVGHDAPLDWAVRLTRAGLLVALVNACTTALVAAALWLHRYDSRRGHRPWQSSVLAAFVIAFGLQVVLGMIAFALDDPVADLAVLALATAALLLLLRFVIHDALLVEGAEHGVGPDGVCPECHRIVPTMAFCPACGAARAAGAKHGRPRMA